VKFFIKVGSVLTTEGKITDITFNNEERLKETITKSTVLNYLNTYSMGKRYHSTQIPRVVFSEIERYLSYKLGEKSFQGINGYLLEWEE